MSNMLNVREAIACIKVGAPDMDGDAALHLTGDDAPVLTPLGANMNIAYLVDDGASLAYVQARHLDQLDGRRDRLARLGLRNLMKLAGERMKVRTYNNIYAVFLDGHFEASLTLLNELWDETLAGMVPNGPIVAMPTRDVLAFCDAESRQGIAELQDMVARVWRDGTPDHALSRDLFYRTEQRWKTMRSASAR